VLTANYGVGAHAAVASSLDVTASAAAQVVSKLSTPLNPTHSFSRRK